MSSGGCARFGIYDGGGALSRNHHAFRSGESWGEAYPEFGKTAHGKFQASPQHSAQGYLDYVSCLLSRSESFTPVGTADRPNGECSACKSARVPRSFPLSYVIAPLNATDTSIQSIQTILLQGEICGAVLPRIQDPYTFLAPLNTGEICDVPIPSFPSVTDVAHRARQSEVLAICIERNSCTSKLHTELAFGSRIQYAGVD